MTREQVTNQLRLIEAVQGQTPGGFVSLPFAMAKTLFEMAEAYLTLTENRGGYAAEEQQ